MVTDGRIPHGAKARAACGRFLADLARAESGRGEWAFNPVTAEAAILFCGAMPNIKGPEAGQPMHLLDWELFTLVNLFGFIDRKSGYRRFRQAVIYIPRGNGKSSFMAAVCLFMTFVEGEGGAEGYSAAVTRDQARILFDMANQMAKRSSDFRAEFGVATTTRSVFQHATASSFGPLSSDAKSLDGLNVHVAVCDEIASHKNSSVYDVLLTATGKRAQPMIISISTATDNAAGIGKILWDLAERVLLKGESHPTLFALIFDIDETDDPWLLETWRKANPGWGRTVMPDAVEAIARQARSSPAQEAAFKTRHLNMWVGADKALFSPTIWRLRHAPGLRLEDMKGHECYVAVDLATRIDMASLALVFPERDETINLKYKVFARHYLPEQALVDQHNASYAAWAKQDWITLTPGNEIDFSWIEADLLAFNKDLAIKEVAYDPYQAVQLSQRMAAEGLPMVEFRAVTLNFSEPTKELQAAINAGRLEHDGNPVLAWNIGNVVGHFDARDNVYPRKARPENKIDGAIALIMGVGRALQSYEGPSVYETRGIAQISVPFTAPKQPEGPSHVQRPGFGY